MEVNKEIFIWLVNGGIIEEKDVGNYTPNSSVILNDETSRLFDNGLKLAPMITALYKVNECFM